MQIILQKPRMGLENLNGFFIFIDFGELSCNNFVLETTIRNAIDEGALTCQEAYIQIHFEDGYAVIPISIPGCVSNLTLIYNDYV